MPTSGYYEQGLRGKWDRGVHARGKRNFSRAWPLAWIPRP